jgi:hypothetical protein
MGTHVLPPLAVNSKPEQKTTLLLQGFDPATFGTPTHCYDHTAKSNPSQNKLMLTSVFIVKFQLKTTVFHLVVN